METNDINNSNNNETTSLNITDNDVNDILEENGITEDDGILDPEFEEIPEENYYNENQEEEMMI